MKDIQNNSNRLLKWVYETGKWLLGISICYVSFTLILSIYIFITYQGPIRLRNSLLFFTDEMLALYNYLQMSVPAVDGEYPNFWRLWWLFIKPIWGKSIPNESFLGKWQRNLFSENNTVFILIFLANLVSLGILWAKKTRTTMNKEKQKVISKKKIMGNYINWMILGINFFGLGLLWLFDFIYGEITLSGFFRDLYIWSFYTLFISIFGVLNYFSYFLLEEKHSSIPARQAILFLLNSLPIFGGWITKMWYMAGIYVDYEFYFWPQVVTLKFSFIIWILVLVFNLIQNKISKKHESLKKISFEPLKSTHEKQILHDFPQISKKLRILSSSKNKLKSWLKTYGITVASFFILLFAYFIWDYANNPIGYFK